jgi:putative phosphoesterase
MRYAIISDIHANLEALTTALDHIDSSGIDEIVCLGDIVGYGANPNECIDITRQRCTHVVMGNHDSACVDLLNTADMTINARKAAFWTHDHLTPASRDYLAQLPLRIDHKEFTLVHGYPYRPGNWDYLLSRFQAEIAFQYFETRVCFIGHTHVPAHYHTSDTKPGMLRTGKHIINVGSVGQPRDGDSRLSFGILDTEMWYYENVRLDYPKDAAADKIREAGLPELLADRLLAGV